MSFDLMLKPSCDGCGADSGLFGSNCKHMTVCFTCGKKMAENRSPCVVCGVTVTRLIQEYNVRASTSTDKNYFIGRFVSGIPNFSKKKGAENKWVLHKDGLQGCQLIDALKEKYKNKPWLLEDETGQYQWQGVLEGSQSATYYLLVKQGKEFIAIPAGSWYNFNKVAQYKQLTLDEAEEKMRNRKKTAEGYQRWIMKTATSGPTAFGEVEKLDDNDGGAKSGRKKTGGDDDEANVSDRGEEDGEDEANRKSRLGLNKKGGDDDDEGPRGGDHDMDDDDIEKGDDWEHKEIFTDDDEAVGNDPEEREDLGPELPAPPVIKQEEDEDGEGGLSKSGKELKKLLGRTAGDSDSDGEDDDDVRVDDDTSVPLSPEAKKKDAIKEEPTDNNPPKTAPSSTSAQGTPSKSAKGKRKLNSDEAKASNVASAKKVKTENESKPIKEEVSASKSKDASASKSNNAPSKGTPTPSCPVNEEEIRAVLLQKEPVTPQNLSQKFKARLKSSEVGLLVHKREFIVYFEGYKSKKMMQDWKAFADILKRNSRMQKTKNSSYFILKDK